MVNNINAQDWLDQVYFDKNGVCQIETSDKGNDDSKGWNNKGKKKEQITKLDISKQNLTDSLDLSKFVNLKTLNCSNNNLLTIKIDGSQLEELICKDNYLPRKGDGSRELFTLTSKEDLKNLKHVDITKTDENKDFADIVFVIDGIVRLPSSPFLDISQGPTKNFVYNEKSWVGEYKEMGGYQEIIKAIEDYVKNFSKDRFGDLMIRAIPCLGREGGVYLGADTLGQFRPVGDDLYYLFAPNLERATVLHILAHEMAHASVFIKKLNGAHSLDFWNEFLVGKDDVKGSTFKEWSTLKYFKDHCFLTNNNDKQLLENATSLTSSSLLKWVRNNYQDVYYPESKFSDSAKISYQTRILYKQDEESAKKAWRETWQAILKIAEDFQTETGKKLVSVRFEKAGEVENKVSIAGKHWIFIQYSAVQGFEEKIKHQLNELVESEQQAHQVQPNK